MKQNWNFSKFIKNNYLYIILGSLIITVVILAMMMGKKEHFENQKSLEYYFMKSCPHCQDFNPVWEKLVVEIEKQKINVKTAKYDITGTDEERAKKFQVNGAPTILLVQDEKLLKEYSGPRTVDAIIAFLK